MFVYNYTATVTYLLRVFAENEEVIIRHPVVM